MNAFISQEILAALLLPAHLLVMVGGGLLLGQQGIRHGVSGSLLFLGGILVGLGLMHAGTPAGQAEAVLLLLAAVCGGLLAWKMVLPLWVSALLVTACSVLMGLNAEPSLIPGIRAATIYAILAGIAVAATLGVALLAAMGFAVHRVLNGMVLRVLGSWIMASAMMVLTLQLAPGLKGQV